MQDYLTPPEIAKLLRVRGDKVLAWIRSGQLVAFNVAEKVNGRPKYRVARGELEAFIQRRAVVPPPPPARIGRPPGTRPIPKPRKEYV